MTNSEYNDLCARVEAAGGTIRRVTYKKQMFCALMLPRLDYPVDVEYSNEGLKIISLALDGFEAHEKARRCLEVIEGLYDIFKDNASTQMQSACAGLKLAIEFIRDEFDIGPDEMSKAADSTAQENETMDWEKAENHLKRTEEAYKGLIGMPQVNPGFAISMLAGIRQRFESGDRAKSLYDEIMLLE